MKSSCRATSSLYPPSRKLAHQEKMGVPCFLSLPAREFSFLSHLTFAPVQHEERHSQSVDLNFQIMIHIPSEASAHCAGFDNEEVQA